LLRRADVEFPAGDLVDLDLEFGQALFEIGRQRPELRRVDLDAGCLHMRKHGDQRPFDGLVHAHHVLGHEAWLQMRPQLQGDVGVLGGIVARLVERYMVEGHLLGTAAGDIGELDGLLSQMPLGQLVHAVAMLAGIEHEGEQHGVVDRADLDVVAAEHGHVVFDVLADLQYRGVLQQGL